MTTIHLVGGYLSARASLSYLLSEQGYSAISHESGSELLGVPPDDLSCIIFDLETAKPAIDEFQEALRTRGCTAPLIVIGSQREIRDGIRAVRNGAVDFLLKPARLPDFICAIEASRNSTVCSARQVDARALAKAKLRNLTGREMDILQGLVAGMTNKEMARRLSLSPRTIEMHRANLMGDLGLKSLAGLIRLATDADVAPLDCGGDPLAVGVGGPAKRRSQSPRCAAASLEAALPPALDVLEATTDCTFILDAQDRFVYLNRNALETIAGGRDLIGECVWKMFPGTKSTRAYVHLREAAEERRSVRFDFYEPELQLWFDVNVRPIRHGLLVCFHDLTPKRTALAALKMNEERLEQVLDAAGDAAWDLDLRTGRIEMWHKLIERLGYAEHEVEWTLDGARRLVHPADLERLDCALERHVAGECDMFQSEHRFRTKSGGWAWILARGRIVVRDSRTGEPVRMVGTASDVTWLKELEAASREAHERLALAQRAAGAGLWDLELSTGELRLCPRTYEMLGIKPDYAPVTESDWGRCVHPADAEQVRRAIEKAVATGEPYSHRFRVVRADGSCRVILGLGKVVAGSDGHSVRFVGLNLDLSAIAALRDGCSSLD